MRPVTDGHNVSRAKLAFLIDATAAPVCIISPISSWAAAVCGFVDGEDGMNLFVSAIPYNFYAILMVVLMIGMVLAKVEFGPMELHERNAERGICSQTATSACRKMSRRRTAKREVWRISSFRLSAWLFAV